LLEVWFIWRKSLLLKSFVRATKIIIPIKSFGFRPSLGLKKSQTLYQIFCSLGHFLIHAVM
jgi:hypothetical protein